MSPETKLNAKGHNDARTTLSPKQSEKAPPDIYQVVVQCRDETEQRALFERLKAENFRVRLLVL